VKICHIGNPNSLNVKPFVEHFSRRGDEVHIFGWGGYRFPVNENIHYHELSRKGSSSVEERDPEIVKKSSPAIRKKRRSLIMAGMLSVYEYMTIGRLVRSISPDIVHGHEAVGSGMLTARFREFPTILTCWGSDINKFPWESRWAHFKVSYALKRCDIINATNPEFGRTIVERFGIDEDKVKVLSWGVDTALFDPSSIDGRKLDSFREKLGIVGKSPVIVYPAGFRDKDLQNYTLLLRAFRGVREKLPDAVLIMLSYGRTSGIGEMVEYIDKNEMWDSVRIIDDMIPQEDMPYLFACSDITTVLHDRDQMAASISESILMGNVTVLSRIEPYVKRFGEEGAPYVDQKSVRDIERVILDVASNIERYRKEFTEKNREDVIRDRSRAHQMELVEELYEELIESKRKA